MFFPWVNDSAFHFKVDRKNQHSVVHFNCGKLQTHDIFSLCLNGTGFGQEGKLLKNSRLFSFSLLFYCFDWPIRIHLTREIFSLLSLMKCNWILWVKARIKEDKFWRFHVVLLVSRFLWRVEEYQMSCISWILCQNKVQDFLRKCLSTLVGNCVLQIHSIIEWIQSFFKRVISLETRRKCH